MMKTSESEGRSRVEEWVASKKTETNQSSVKRSKRSLTLRISEEDFLYLERVARERGYTRTALAEKIMAFSICDVRAIWDKEDDDTSSED